MNLDTLLKPFEELADKYDCSKPSTLSDQAGKALRELIQKVKGSPQLKLFLVTDNDRWGYSVNVVRARDAEAASRLVSPRKYPNPSVHVEQVPDGNLPAILWCKDESPDSERE